MKSVLSILLLLFVTVALADSNVIPKEVNAGFKKKFQEAKDVTWEERNGNFEATFYLHDELTIALFSDKGVWLETASSISLKDITENVMLSLDERFGDFDIINSYRVTDNDDQTFFRLLIGSEEGDYLVELSESGKLLSIRKQTTPDADQELDNEEE